MSPLSPIILVLLLAMSSAAVAAPLGGDKVAAQRNSFDGVSRSADYGLMWLTAASPRKRQTAEQTMGSGQLPAGLPALSANPSQTIPSGPRDSMKDCMDTWDRDTHMSKSEWRQTCERTLKEQPDIVR